MPPVDPAFRHWSDTARRTPIADVAAGRGLRLRGGIERVGPCPDCGGRDRFGINTRKNVFGCRQCGKAGGPIDLVMMLDGLTFVQACERLTGQPPPDCKESGLPPERIAEIEAAWALRRSQSDAAEARFVENERQKMRRQWERAKPAPYSLVEDYLRLRAVALPPGATLRFMPDWTLFHDHNDAANKAMPAALHRGPCMFAAICGPDGHFSALHMTWLDLSRPDGKAQVPDPKTGEFVTAKKVRGVKKGGRIELVRPPHPRRLVIGEGIETTLSVRQALLETGEDLSRVAFWCAIDLQNLGGMHLGKVVHPTMRRIDSLDRSYPLNVPGPVPDLDAPAIPIPDSVEEVITLGDGDSDPFTARQAHARAATRWARPGRRVIPLFSPPGTDFNSFLRGQS